MMTDFGPFGALFNKDSPLRLNYLPLLNVMDASDAVAHIRAVLSQPDNGLDALLAAMLAERNWRPQLVAITTMLIGQSSENLPGLWSAMDRHSWISPQIAAVASRIDGGFVAKARRRLTAFCGAEGRRTLPRFRLMTSPRLAIPIFGTDADPLACILAALCRREKAAESWLPEILAHPDLVEALSGDEHEYQRGSIALRWRDAMDDLLARRGSPRAPR